MKIKKEKLLLVSGIVWGSAGVNILRLGISCFVRAFFEKTVPILLLMVFLSALILIGFLMMFKKVIYRNTCRILSYEGKKNVFAFFDLKGYFLMAFMMTLGITLRSLVFIPSEFFAVFYTGLGLALTSSGVIFALKFFKSQKSEKGKNEDA